MLGCIKPMSSPMMKRMLGLLAWATAAGASSTVGNKMAVSNRSSRLRVDIGASIQMLGGRLLHYLEQSQGSSTGERFLSSDRLYSVIGMVAPNTFRRRTVVNA